ncbi:nicotinamidase-related amidase [Nocardia sp. GAS34]|uniref:cysteine hydrolase family protein n=1 Tax=unclassified Nocardia TaxID=2637762 RepID=UPI003D217CCE
MMTEQHCTTALLVCDVQTGITRDFPFARPVIPVLATAVPAARRAGVKIVYVRAGLRSNAADVHPNNLLFQQFHALGTTFHENSSDTHIDGDLDIDPSDIVVLKRRTNAFAATDLDLVLRSNRIERTVICGVATSAVVTATVYAASDLDYAVTVLADACADQDPELHEVLTTRLFPARGVEVTTTHRWLTALTA